MRRVVLFITLAALVACTPDATEVPISGPRPSSPGVAPTPSATQEHPAPGSGLPKGAVPSSAAGIARTFKALHPQLLKAIDRWIAGNKQVGSALGRAIARAALLRQKIFRTLTKDERLEKAVLARLPRRLDEQIRIHTAASRALSTLVSPVSGPIKLPTKQPDPPHRLRGFYKQAERAFGIPWELLASINLVETRFGRLTGPSTAGAQGPMQFIPSTWAIYGRGDVNDPHDAIMGAARYLKASGAPQDLRSAVFSYNHADAYVNAILTYYDEIRRDPRNFYSYYFWQVFVRTTKGDVQLTGPGGRRSHIR